mmetsp:Transcript_59897/g.167116  ORF Transcript_59897/g.167116 Transcript_59897/m.167116 type:complete len:302 (+) Transcript_59897:327-1232(+)
MGALMLSCFACLPSLLPAAFASFPSVLLAGGALYNGITTLPRASLVNRSSTFLTPPELFSTSATFMATSAGRAVLSTRRAATSRVNFLSKPRSTSLPRPSGTGWLPGMDISQATYASTFSSTCKDSAQSVTTPASPQAARTDTRCLNTAAGSCGSAFGSCAFPMACHTIQSSFKAEPTDSPSRSAPAMSFKSIWLVPPGSSLAMVCARVLMASILPCKTVPNESTNAAAVASEISFGAPAPPSVFANSERRPASLSNPSHCKPASLPFSSATSRSAGQGTSPRMSLEAERKRSRAAGDSHK